MKLAPNLLAILALSSIHAVFAAPAALDSVAVIEREASPEAQGYGDYGNYGKYGSYGSYEAPAYGTYGTYGAYKRAFAMVKRFLNR